MFRKEIYSGIYLHCLKTVECVGEKRSLEDVRSKDRKEGYSDRSHDSIFRDSMRPSLVLSVMMSDLLASSSDCVLVGLFACFYAFLLIFFLRVFYSTHLFVVLVARLIEVLGEVRGSRNSWETTLCTRVCSDIGRSGRLQMWLRDMASSVLLLRR